MVGQIIFSGHMSQIIHFCEREIFRFRDSEHSFSFSIIEEFTLFIQ